MTLKNLNLKPAYDSDEDNILSEFYIPALSKAVVYKRLAGFFTSSSLAIAAKGIAKFILNEGKIQLIANVVLSKEDYEKVKEVTEKPFLEKAETEFIESLENIEDELIRDHVKMLGWMLKNNKIEMKISLVPEGIGIQHQKTGILEDKEGNIVSFSGSDNETKRGWIDNIENFHVFCSWKEDDKEHINADIKRFEKFWNDQAKRTRVFSVSEAVNKKLIKIAPKNDSEFEKLSEKTTKELLRIKDRKKNTIETNQEIKLRGYQEEAIKNWFNNDCKGIFEMATGTGKTYTAVNAMKRLLEKEGKLITVISCPFLHLIPQWENSLDEMDIKTQKIFASSMDSNWKIKLAGKFLDIKLGRLKNIVVLTTHDTSSSEDFKELILGATCPLLLIGDEVHGMGSLTRMEGLLPIYKFRLGLTATPKRYFDDEGTQKLFNFFEKSVYEFSLERAIEEGYLTPYEYYPIFVELNIGELDKYVEISKEIGKLYAMSKNNLKNEKFLEKKLRDRQDIIKNAQNKYSEFETLLKKLKETENLKRTLIYCSPQQKNQIQEIISNEGKIIQHKFTSDEDVIKKEQKYGGLTEREYLLKNFGDGVYDVLVAIKCLDEGVDIPSTKSAILMCSTGNPKEWVQRRGRILRKFPGKEKAIIYDFVVLPGIKTKRETEEYTQKIIQSQFKRIDEFTKIALNNSEISRELFKIKLKYGVG